MSALTTAPPPALGMTSLLRPYWPPIAIALVSFSYGDGQAVIDDVSFAIAPGQVAAFVGPGQ